MRLSVLQTNLAKGLSIVSRAVESRPQMPVLNNVLLRTEDSRLKLAAVNLSLGLGITCWIGANVDIEGAVTLPAKTFNELINNLSNDRVDLNLDTATQTMHVRCGANKGNIKGIDAHEFPPVTEGGRSDLTVDAATLKNMITQVSFAAATDDHRPALTGVLVQFEGDKITMAAADGYRLAVHTGDLEQKFDKPIKLLIPARSLAEVARAIQDDTDVVQIGLPDERDIVLFTVGAIEISAQLLDHKFPPFENVIPKDYSTSTTMYRSDLLSACQRAEIFARDNAFTGRLYVKPPTGPSMPGEVTIIGKSQERGDNEGILDASVEGEPVDISFNIKYLIDVLRILPDEQVVLQSKGPANPGVLRAVGRENYLYVIMPMSR
ncbi:MAG: DNA polymerase III subunit beta [Anaerolineae bacterium]|jgi:DNA polymerase-3 subunit beta|nr:DNA polymerase III subunit beta [Anaerolineae bacterium]